MRGIQIFFLSLLCLVNIAWTDKGVSKVKQDIQKGYEAWQAGNLSEALIFYNSALKIQPKNPDVLNTIGVLYEEFGLSDQAEEKYLAAITLNRKHLPAYSNLGYLYWNRGDLEKAAFYFEKRVYGGNPKDPWTIKARKALNKVIAEQEVSQRDEMKKELDQFNSQNQ
jgi:Flp pilus assembly protein TadD